MNEDHIPDELFDSVRSNITPIAPEWERCTLLDIYSYVDNYGETQFVGIFRDSDNPEYGAFADRWPFNNMSAENGLWDLMRQYGAKS